MHKRMRYILDHWKLSIHIVFHTLRFGVSNKWWASSDSLYGRTLEDRHLRVFREWPFVEGWRDWKLWLSLTFRADVDYWGQK
jgi:hypothetical protein